MKELIDEHDMTKKMLSIVREHKIITENTPVSEGIDLSGPELKEEQKKFRETISPRVDFSVFKIYPQASNVVFAGKFQDMNGMEWEFTLSETNGIYIKVNNLQLTKEAVVIIQKLFGYYQVWSNEWANKLATEYKIEK